MIDPKQKLSENNLTLSYENITFYINYYVSEEIEIDGILGIMALLKDNEIDWPY